MRAPRRLSAAAEVFTITELVEAILLHVPRMRDLFVLQRISRSIRNTIRGSISLQRKMYLAPDPHVPPDNSRRKYPRNPLLFGNTRSRLGERSKPFSVFKLFNNYNEVGRRKKSRVLRISLTRVPSIWNPINDRAALMEFLKSDAIRARDSWATTTIAQTDIYVVVAVDLACSKGHRNDLTIRSLSGATTLGEYADKLVEVLSWADTCNGEAGWNPSCTAREEAKKLFGKAKKQ
nr:hypothetical protein B0A51_01167 [Rachicladosporium sp. CCFEE 5018]